MKCINRTIFVSSDAGESLREGITGVTFVFLCALSAIKQKIHTTTSLFYSFVRSLFLSAYNTTVLKAHFMLSSNTNRQFV